MKKLMEAEKKEKNGDGHGEVTSTAPRTRRSKNKKGRKTSRKASKKASPCRSRGRKVLRLMKKPSARVPSEFSQEWEADDGDDSLDPSTEGPSKKIEEVKPKAKRAAKGKPKAAPKAKAKTAPKAKAKAKSVGKVAKDNDDEGHGNKAASAGKRGQKRPPATPNPFLKRSFARRFAPKSGMALAKWTALREAFNTMVAPNLSMPSSFEAVW